MPRVVAVRAAAGLGTGYSFGNDFYQIWLSSQAWLRHGLDPYSPEMTRQIQIGLYGRPLDPSRPSDPIDWRVFPYPAFTDVLFYPASKFSFETVRVAVACALAVLTVGTVLLWFRAFAWRPGWQFVLSAILLTLCSYPSLEGLFAGQIGLLVAFLLAAAIVALQQNHFLVAGTLMALTTVKPQVTALAILYALVWCLRDSRRRHFFSGFFATILALLGVSLALLPNWIQSWMRTVLAYRHYTRPPLVTEVLTSMLGPQLSGPATFALTVASIVIATVFVWRGRKVASDTEGFRLTISLLLAITSITILPGQAVYDHLILIPGILLVVRHRHRLRSAGPVGRVLLGVGAVVLFWPWMAAFALVVFRPLIPAAIFDSTIFFSLPIRTAASLPFAVLALLAYAVRLSPRWNQEAV